MASTDDLTTARFRVQVPRALLPASRSLAALHATRARLLHHPGAAADALRGTHCARCGAYLLDGSGSVRVVRVPRGRARGGGQGRAAAPCARVLRRTCGVCGGVEDVPVVRHEEAGGSRVVGGRPAEVASASATSAAPSRQPSATPGVELEPSVPSASSSKASTLPKPSAPRQQAQTLDARAKSRPKKKPGLQDLLARNRERQEQEKKAGAGNGLATFLQGL